MTASGPNDKLEVQERYNESSIISRIVGNFFKNEMNGESVKFTQIKDAALFIQRVVGTLDTLQKVADTAANDELLLENQKTSLKELYDYCLNETCLPDQMQELQEKIKKTIDCLYASEGYVTNLFNNLASLCGLMRASLSSINKSELNDMYARLTENAYRDIANKMAISQEGPAYLTRMLANLSLVETQPIVSVIPDAPAPPPVFMPSSLVRRRMSVSGNSSSNVPEGGRLSMDELLAKREAMQAARAGESIEDKLEKSRKQKKIEEPASIQELLMGNEKIQSLRKHR